MNPLFLSLYLLLLTPSFAEEPPPAEPNAVDALESPPPEDSPAPKSDALLLAEKNWRTALNNTPKLVSLKHEIRQDASQSEVIKSRLKLLGEKTFSNREWKSYWEQQVSTASALATHLKETKQREQVDGLTRWSELAQAKVKNQDKYFEAIEAERDALENRLEATLETKALNPPSEKPVSDPNPYERRRISLKSLERQLGVQKQRRASVLSEIQFIEQQLSSEAILATALDRDLELAQTEQQIALDQSKLSGEWSELWSEIASRSEEKVEKIRAESDYGRSRERSRQVELGLAKSQVTLRDERISSLTHQIQEVGSVKTWFAATGETVSQWLQSKAWRILIGLALISFAVKISLKAITYGTQLILEKTDDDPDVEDDNDQRRRTLADVFHSLARITVYTIGGLMALEQIGVNTGPLLGSVAILGLAISFGSQNLVRDVVNGFFILLENQYAVGDVVTINSMTGGVERITIRSTWIRSASGDLHVIPNGGISLVSNLTRGWSRARCEIGVAYDADLKHVKEVINRVGQEMYADPELSKVLSEAPAWVGVTVLGDSSVTVRAQVKVLPGEQWGVTRALNERLKVAFDAEGIEIPFPQRVIHSA